MDTDELVRLMQCSSMDDYTAKSLIDAGIITKPIMIAEKPTQEYYILDNDVALAFMYQRVFKKVAINVSALLEDVSKLPNE